MATSLVPTPLSPLIGRQREVAEVSGLFACSRLVSLTGAGGSGKTRLALEVATRAASGPDHRVAWVELAPLDDGSLLPDHIAAAVEARPGPGRDSTQALISALQPHTLLVLDNCEHVVASTASLAEALLRGCASLQILATSREPLGIPGERLWPVPPLSVPISASDPDLAEAQRSEAVQLFVACAREANPSFRLTAENVAAVVAICRRLDGLPLALELAAARTRVLTVAQIAQRLDDTFQLLTSGGRTSLPRHRTLRGAFDWSHALLNAPQQVLLRRLSVFAGSFAIEAVEEICSGPTLDRGVALEQNDVLDTLASLVDRSLVLLEPDEDRARYRLLETVRQYGREHLRRAGEEELMRRRHAELYVELAEALAPSLFGGAGSPELMRLVDLEHDNFRTAYDSALRGAGGAEAALRLGYALHWYWFARGLMLEGQRRLQGALRLTSPVSPVVRAWANLALGSIHFWLGTPWTSLGPLRESIQVLRTANEPFSLAYGLSILAALELSADPRAAEPPAIEAAALIEQLPKSVLTAFALYWRGLVAQALGDLELARRCFERCEATGRELGHPATLGHSLAVLGGLELGEGRLDEAWRYLDESLRIHVRTGDSWGIVLDLKLLAQTMATRGRLLEAARLLGTATRLGEEVGIAAAPQDAMRLAAISAELERRLGDDELKAALAAGRQTRPEELPGLLDTLGGALGESPSLPVLNTAEASPCCTRAVSIAEFMDKVPAPAASPFGRGDLTFVISVLGPTRIQRCEVDCSSEGWGSARTRELLVFLLFHPEGVTKEEVGAALWPEASSSQVRNSFHVTLHRLRSALRDPQSVRSVAGRYALDPALRVELDAEQFERRARAAIARLRGGEDALSDLLAAVELYRGDLLQGENAGEWHLELRDRLRQLFLQGLDLGGRALLAADRSSAAAVLYRRWIALDDLAEEAYRQLLLCLEDLGEHHEAFQLYRRLVKVLAGELGVEPDPRTTAILRRIERDARR